MKRKTTKRAAPSKPARGTRTEGGLVLRAGERWFELALHAPGVFRLSVSDTQPSPVPTSLFLDPAPRAPSAPRRVREGKSIGIADANGALFVDPTTGAWTLRDAAGNTLVRPLATTNRTINPAGVGRGLRSAPLRAAREAQTGRERSPGPTTLNQAGGEDPANPAGGGDPVHQQTGEPAGVGRGLRSAPLRAAREAQTGRERSPGPTRLNQAGGEDPANPAGGGDPAHQQTGEPAGVGRGLRSAPLRAAAGEAVELDVGWRRDTPVAGYGCGNNALSLVQSEGPSSVGNGRAVVPFLWCPQGYAMLAVTEDDARPATWRADSTRSRVVWTFPGRVAHLFLVPAPDLKAACRALVTLTGRAPVPPRWTFGYLQSRWGWRDRADVEATLRQFRRRRFPVDAFILDFEWYTKEPDYEVPPSGLRGFPDFGVNPSLFPEPARQLAAYHADGLRIVAIRKPRIGDATTLRWLRDRKWTLRFPGHDPRKWSVRELDFRIPDLRRWYAEQMRPLLGLGFDAWWNDEGESSYVTYFLWNVAEEALAREVRPRQRFWSLNRAFIPGMQRLGATAWTGDAYATWDALAATPTHLLNWGLAGMSYAGCDIGGFRGEVPPELFVRWMQAGVFFPMMRAHTAIEWTPRLPWRFGRRAEQALRIALELRYRLVPYLYSLAHESHATGLPVMRPLALEFPDDPLVANISDQWMLGARVMAAPILTPGTRRRVYLPDGDWFRLGSHDKLSGGRRIEVAATLDEIPAFVRAGSVLPLGPVVPSTAALPGGPLEVQVYPGADAEFTLVEDDGTTVAYRDGAVRRTTFRWNDRRRKLTWTTEGAYDGPEVFREVRVAAPGGDPEV